MSCPAHSPTEHECLSPSRNGYVSAAFSKRRHTIHDLLATARAGLCRLSAEEALRALQEGALLVDTRTEDQRRTDGIIPGSTYVRLSELE